MIKIGGGEGFSIRQVFCKNGRDVTKGFFCVLIYGVGL